MFSTTDKIFTTTTSFQHTVTTLSLHNQISTSTTTSLQHPKITTSQNDYFLSPHIKFYEKQVSLINKLLPLSYQFTSNITHAFHFTRLNQPLKYTTLLHYSHIPNTDKKNSRLRCTSTPKYTLPQRLLWYLVLPFKSAWRSISKLRASYHSNEISSAALSRGTIYLVRSSHF